ncbi:MAG: hypothetical protein JSR82_03475 [Verrucomicrobia bacterium]|nr:hypothetical protein [Verrucomicrobiota bacterium]
MRPSPLLLCLPLFASPLSAGPRSSANYAITAESCGNAGQRVTSANYTHDTALGGSATLARSTSADYTNKSGYAGQLTDPTGLQLDAASLNIAENGTLQLGAAQVQDDDTTTAVSASAVAWAVAAGPVTGISGSGLATAGSVYQNTSATVQGSLAGFTGMLNLTVLDTLPDNFGSYANDGIDDSWQVQYFGLNNPSAAPGVDASGTGQTNLFKFVAGLHPLDANSRFVIRATPVSGQPGQKQISFSPVVAGRTYTIRAAPDLTSGTWTTLSGGISVVGNEGTFLDVNAGGTRRFYEVQVTR